MKYSKTTLMELSHRYSNILKKCALLNATILMGAMVALPVMADTYTERLVLDKETVLDTPTMQNITNSAIGGSIYNSSKLTIKNGFLANNHSASAGVLYDGSLKNFKNKESHSVTIIDSEIKSNSANDFGAVAIFSPNSMITNTKFIENEAKANYNNLGDGAGALFLGSESQTIVSDSLFEKNKSGTIGGAIATRPINYWLDTDYSGKGTNNSVGAKVDIINSKFNNNIAGTRGGAVFNSFYNSNNKAGSAFISKSIFTANQADLGGAIYSEGWKDASGNYANLYIEDSTFTKNIANSDGGAIYNSENATLTLAGTNIFSGNTAGGKANDIYNAGTLNISGNLTLDGGIVNTGDINFASGSQLKATLNNTTALISGGTVKGTTSLVVENGKTSATFKLFDKEQTFTLTNTLYTITNNNDGSYEITKKSNEQIVENLTSAGATAQEAATISAIASSTSDNAILKAISTAVQSGDVAQAAQAAKELAPTTSQQVMGVAQGVNNVLSNVTGNRMSAMGRAGGDAFIGGALWVQGLYNHTKQDANASSDGFTANTRGIAFGIDGKVNEAVTLGLGYGYTNTNADAGNNDVDVDGHNVFAYAQYQPNAWYINGMISYGLSKYTEEKAPMGIMMKTKYDVDTYSANLTTGYDFASGITPYAGLRYILAKQDAYSDGAQYIKSDDNDLLTGILGAKYSADIKTKDFTFAPNIRLAATYDFISDNSVANVNIIGGGNYQITGERLKRFGVETGVGVETTWGDWNLSLDYNGSFKKDFQSHTGMLKAKYNF